MAFTRSYSGSGHAVQSPCPCQLRPLAELVVTVTRALVRSIYLLFFNALIGACASAPVRRIEANNSIIAFTGVTVISNYGGARLTNQTVLVQRDRILTITSDAAATIPTGSKVIEGNGRFLVPGLADMHTHYSNPGVGPLFLANSITTVRNPAGGKHARELERSIRSGERIGPQIYLAGEVIDGPGSFWGNEVTVQTVEEMRARVDQDADAGYTAVKFYDRLTPGQFTAGVKQAQLRGLKVYAHAPDEMAVEEVLSSGIDSLEHLDGFDRALGGQGPNSAVRWSNADVADAPRLAAIAEKSGIWNTPTLIVEVAPARAEESRKAGIELPELRYADAGLRQFWSSFSSLSGGMTPELAKLGHMNRTSVLRALRLAGAPVLIGTDAPAPYVMYGFSLHDEFELFRTAGYSNVEILRIATLDAARFLGQQDEFGAIRKGMRADLVLLEKDPEADLSTLRHPAGVMAAGRWYPATVLEQALVAIAGAARLRADPVH